MSFIWFDSLGLFSTLRNSLYCVEISGSGKSLRNSNSIVAEIAGDSESSVSDSIAYLSRAFFVFLTSLSLG